jgi:hypothetical protein
LPDGVGVLARQPCDCIAGPGQAGKDARSGRITVASTIGTVDVAFSLQVWRVVCVTMSSSFRRTISASRPWAQRTSMTMRRPSTPPRSRSHRANAASGRASVEGVIAPKKLIVRVAGYARAAPGPIHAAPNPPLNCRAVSQNADKNVVPDIRACASSVGHVQTQRSIGARA